MNATAKKLRHIVKAATANDGEFIADDAIRDYGILSRIVRYGLGERIAPGRYKLSIAPGKFAEAYNQKAKEHLASGQAHAGKVMREKAMSANKSMPSSSTPNVRIMPYDDQHSLIMIGKRMFLGHEVALASKGGKANG